MSAETEKSSSPLNIAGSLVGAAFGWAFSRYCGGSAWIPGITALLLLVLFTKTPFHPARFQGAIAVTAAHLLWFLLASLLSGIWSATFLDIIFLSAAIIWLWVRPGLAAVLFLAIIQGISLAVNLHALIGAAAGSPEHRALTAHCVFRAVAIGCLIAGYIRMRRELSAPPQSTDTEVPAESTMAGR